MQFAAEVCSVCEAATSLPAPFHPPFTHCVPPIIHLPYEWKWRQKVVVKVEDGGDRHTARIKSLYRDGNKHPTYTLKRTEEKLVMFVPEPALRH